MLHSACSPDMSIRTRISFTCTVDARARAHTHKSHIMAKWTTICTLALSHYFAKWMYPINNILLCAHFVHISCIYVFRCIYTIYKLELLIRSLAGAHFVLQYMPYAMWPWNGKRERERRERKKRERRSQCDMETTAATSSRSFNIMEREWVNFLFRCSCTLLRWNTFGISGNAVVLCLVFFVGFKCVWYNILPLLCNIIP